VFLGLVVVATRQLDRAVFRSVIGSVGRAFGYAAIVAWLLLGITGVLLANGDWSRTLVTKTGFAALALLSAAAHTVTGRSSRHGLLVLSRSLAGVTFLATLVVFWFATQLS
jgi:hypothetical protein